MLDRAVRSPRNNPLAAAGHEKNAIQKQLKGIEREIENLLDRVVDAASPSVVSAYEARIEKLEHKKIVLAERLAKAVPPKGRLDDCIELALRFLANPWYIYEKRRLRDTSDRTKTGLSNASQIRQKWSVWNSRFFVPFQVLGKNFR